MKTELRNMINEKEMANQDKRDPNLQITFPKPEEYLRKLEESGLEEHR